MLVHGIWLLVLGVLGAANLIIARIPTAKDLIVKMAPYQGWFGFVSMFYGLYETFQAIMNLSLIHIFDEATSALDNVTERKVKENLDGLGCTRIVIAHRLSTIRNADVILVMEDGKLVEQGTHAALLARRGAYARLIEAEDGVVRPPSVEAVEPIQLDERRRMKLAAGG